MDIDEIKRQMKEKRKLNILQDSKKVINTNPKIFAFVTKMMILSILFLSTLIYTKTSTSNKQFLYDALFKDNFSFAPVNEFYNKYLGGILPFENLIKDAHPVFKEDLEYKEANIYKDGVALTVEDSYLIPALDSGIVVFIGEKEEYGKTVIVQQVDGFDVWYSNIDNINVKIYDYIESGSLLGESIDDKLYLVFKKEGKVIDYKEYLQ